MHDYILPQALIERVTARSGKPHPFDHLEPSRTALLVIDMQNYFVMPGFFGEAPVARAIVPAINALASAFRERGAPVIWIKNTTTGTRESWSVYHQFLLTPENRERRYREQDETHEGHRLVDGLETHPGDITIVKKRFSPFVDGSSDLNAILRTRGIDALAIAGTATNICCETTARDAMMLNYRAVMVSDALAAGSDEQHANALNAVYGTFADVQTHQEVIASLDRAALGGA